MIRTRKIMMYITFSVLLTLFMFPIFFTESMASEVSLQNQNSDVLSANTSSYENIFISKLNRTIKIQDNAYVVIDDKFEFLNNQTNSLVSVHIGFNDINMDQMLFYEAKGENLSPLSCKILSEKLNGSYILEIILNQPLLPFSIVTIQLSTIFKANFDFYEPEMSWYGLDCQILPITPYEIIDYTAIVYLPGSSSDLSVTPDEGTGDEGSRTFIGGNIQAFESFTLNFRYRNYIISNLQMESLVRTISINPWGYITIKEKHTLKNFARISAHVLLFEVPAGAYNFSIFDEIGEITGITEKTDANNGDRKTFSIELSINRAEIEYSASMSYQIEYRLPYEEFITNHLGVKNLRIDFFPTQMDYIIKYQKVTIEILGVNSVIRVNIPENQLVRTSSGVVIEKISQEITPYHNILLDISYRSNFLWFFNRAIIFALISIGILGLYTSLRNRQREKGTDKENFIETAVPIRELNQFVTLIEEKYALLLDIEKTDSDLIRRRIQKKAYTKTIKNYQGKLKDLEEEILPFKKHLIESGGQIQSIIQKLDYLEAEKMSVKDSRALLTDRYKRGKLPSKAAYQRLSDDMMKQLISSQKKIDRYVNELKAFLI